LTFYASPTRNDFGFRTGVFEGFPEVIESNQFALNSEEWYHFDANISSDEASYDINGKLFQKVTLIPGDVQSQGYFGFISYNTPYKFKNLTIY